MPRRGLLGVLGAAALLAGCGFRPLYGPGGGIGAGATADVRGALQTIRVALVQERFGQLIRRALYQRLGQDVTGPATALYELRVSPSLQTEGVGIQRDGTATRVRYLGTANWLLVRLGPPVETVASGVERSVEAYNIPPNQFFASDSSREAAEQRLAEVLSELVVTRIAVDFRRRAAGEPALPAAAVPAVPPLGAPVVPTSPDIVPGPAPVLR
ncbi:LPS assembly lipoprotein LptE [Falsiroseomonas selenitidurans]|uniref:LPS assembly lipoprotein LptE n=1 Tax=Falsiroseomonas selenitidurans TaxID=2716335 RepID=UPI00143C9DA9|nr:LPS assembly lipoprotein LptE [Falsiroseomonas selenitidurans]